jgi:ribosomal subunit interface protein
MNIITKKTLDVTGPLETYIDEKLGALEKLVKNFDDAAEGGLTLRVEIARTTAHHRKGEDIFTASALLELPGHDLRAEGTADDVRIAIDRARDILREEIEHYKSKLLEHHRGTKER